jgi:hypothetical protein
VGKGEKIAGKDVFFLVFFLNKAQFSVLPEFVLPETFYPERGFDMTLCRFDIGDVDSTQKA